jgi:N-acetylglucosamine-6-phosphate deacetylase
MILKNAMVLDEEFKFRRLDVGITGERISLSNIGNSGKVLDLDGMYLVPGLIDTHIHGAYGAEADSETKESLDTISRFEASHGVTTFVPTIRTLPISDMVDAIKAITSVEDVSGAKIGGIHIEGPFVSHKYKGALLEEYIIEPSVEILRNFCDAGKGTVKIITLSPELNGADILINYAVSQGIIVSMGHTNASFEETERAVNWGATQVTHLFNAMRPLNHREPGVLGYVLNNNNIKCELICDFVHVHPTVVEMAFKIKGDELINIISDSSSAAGLGDGEFSVSGQTRYVSGGVARTKSGTIAGSIQTVLNGVQNLVSIGIPLETAVKTASINPAKTLGIDGETGSIQCGKFADLLVLDNELKVQYTFINGKCVYKAQ